MKKPSVINVVHCIDTEGPLYESLFAKFERLDDLFGIKIDPTQQNFEKLQKQEFDLLTGEINSKLIQI